MNYVNYVKHTLYTPDTYHRRYDYDLPKKDTEAPEENQVYCRRPETLIFGSARHSSIEAQRSERGSPFPEGKGDEEDRLGEVVASPKSKVQADGGIKRVALVALPFIGLYRPIGSILSIGMGAFRAFTHMSGAFLAEKAHQWGAFAISLLQTAFAVLALVATIFHFAAGLMISTLVDAVQSTVSAVQAFIAKNPKEGCEEILQSLTSFIYLFFMVNGALEAMLLFALLQAVLSIYQARNEIAEGRYLEAAAKIGMAGIRFYQANDYRVLIQRRNQLQKMQQYAFFIAAAMKGREVRHLIQNQLLEGKDPAQLQNADGEQFDFGAYFHGYGEELVKGANLNVRTKIIDGKEITELDFKVNHVFRDKIKDSLKELSKLKSKEIREILQFSQSHATGFKIEQSSLPLGGDTQGDATKITLNGLGSIFIGSSEQLPGMYDRVVVQMEANKTIYDFHELMAFANLDRSIRVSGEEQMDRLKMGHLFRIFFPREATPFERSEEFFTLPLDQLKEKMIQKAPEMKAIFEEYTITPSEILPGKTRYRVEGLAQTVHDAGARALTAVVTGAWDDATLFSRVASMLQMGMLSSETRAEGNMNAYGMSPSADFMSGGADSVFTQMITEKNCKDGFSFNQLHYQGKARFVIGLEALETGSYQYYTDSFGNRHIKQPSWWGGSYSNRPSILEFTKTMQDRPTPWGYGGHEVMLKERIDPSLFRGIILSDQATKNNLLNYLTDRGLVQNGMILGKSADQFLRVGSKASEEILA